MGVVKKTLEKLTLDIKRSEAKYPLNVKFGGCRKFVASNKSSAFLQHPKKFRKIFHELLIPTPIKHFAINDNAVLRTGDMKSDTKKGDCMAKWIAFELRTLVQILAFPRIFLLMLLTFTNMFIRA